MFAGTGKVEISSPALTFSINLKLPNFTFAVAPSAVVPKLNTKYDVSVVAVLEIVNVSVCDCVVGKYEVVVSLPNPSPLSSGVFGLNWYANPLYPDNGVYPSVWKSNCIVYVLPTTVFIGIYKYSQPP